MNTPPSDSATEIPEPRWYLVGNVVREHPFGPGGEETRIGSKHFGPGTKVYVLPGNWDGYLRDDVEVVGRPRRSHRYVAVVMRASLVENWRAQLVRSPALLRFLWGQASGAWPKERVEALADYKNGLRGDPRFEPPAA